MKKKARLSVRKRFLKFHAKRPDIYPIFRKFTFELIDAGRTRFSAISIIYRIRWFTDVSTTIEDPKGFKINNDWAAHYARMFIKEFPQYEKFFRKRYADGDDEEAERKRRREWILS